MKNPIKDFPTTKEAITLARALEGDNGGPSM